MRTYTIALLMLSQIAATGGESNTVPKKFPLWDGKETIEQYAKRAELPATKTIELDDAKKIELVLVPAGQFEMGAPKPSSGNSPDELPQHKVTITRPFYLGKYEVTKEQYASVMKKGANKSDEATMPVSEISWNDAQEFCKTLSQKLNAPVRLPTEAEWEFACRAGTTTTFNVGDELGEKDANVSTFMNKSFGSKSVGSYKPNSWGLYDMHGNVFEWCQDWYDSEYYKNSPPTDPQGPATGTKKVLRGGSFQNFTNMARSTARQPIAPDAKFAIYGFRLALSAENSK